MSVPVGVSGVYQIVHTDTGRMYVGSSGRVKVRIREHKLKLRNRGHDNRHLQAAWDLCGESAFEFRLVIQCTKDMTKFYEQLVMDAYKPHYNRYKSAYGMEKGAKLSRGVRRKVGEKSTALWTQSEYRDKVTGAINLAMTEEECAARTVRTSKLWARPEYRKRAVLARLGNTFAAGHKCTVEQIENRRRAGRISNSKRTHGDRWREEYVLRYPEYAGDVNE